MKTPRPLPRDRVRFRRPWFNAKLSLVAAVLLAGAGTALGVGVSRWTHTTESDFSAGQCDGVVVTNLGDLKLSRSTRSILPPDPRVGAVYALVEAPDGAVYAGTGPRGVLLRIENDVARASTVLGDNLNLYALRVDRAGRLLIGTGGERGEVFRIDKPGDEPRRIFSADGVQYVWAIHETEDGTVYLATGPLGQLFAISPIDGSARVVFDSDENNLLNLLGEPSSDLLYAGTDPGGLLLRINGRTGECFVMYDAPESEISALAWDGQGRILAATAQATGDAEAAGDEGAGDRSGRPGGESGGVPIPAVPPENPTPPQLPDPPPGEPRPIPKERHFALLFADDPVAPGDDAETPVAAPASQAVPAVARGAGVIAPAENGNAIYRIDREGFVTELHRAPAAFHALLATPGDAGHTRILTGASGGADAGARLLQLEPDADERLTLANIDPRQILCLVSARNGKTYLGCANRGDVIVMDPGFAPNGSFTSPVLDAGQISRFGQIRLRGSLPPGAGVTVCTRSGNVSDPSAVGWSDWTTPVAAQQFLPVGAPPARFLQYRLDFTPGNAGASTPVVQEVEVAYQLPNLAPVVSAVRAEAGDRASPDTRAKITIAWDASDPNGDALSYTLQFRPADGNAPWITLKDRLDASTFEWDTRTTADGRYELRVTASDSTDNASGQGLSASRQSDPVQVDNTPPVIGDVQVQPRPDGGWEIRCVVADQAGTVQRLDFAINGRDPWQMAPPSDMIGDSPREVFVVNLPADGAADPARQVTLRATDAQGNQGFVTVPLPTAGKPAGGDGR